MSTTPNAYGNFLSNPAPFLSNYAAVISPWGTFVKPGGRVAAYVRSTGAQDGEDHFAASGLLVTTLNAGLARCRSGMGDIVLVLPGHSESLSSADAMSSLVAGTQIIGCGNLGQSNAPTLTWSAAAATFLLDVADVTLNNLKLNVAGADNVAAPITVTGAGCQIINCEIAAGTSTSLDATVPITVSTGAHDFLFQGNRCYSSGGALSTQFLLISAAVNRPKIMFNDIDIEVSANSVGVITISAAATQVRIVNNTLCNRRANASAAIINFSDTAGLEGIIAKNYFKFTADVTAATAAIVAAGSSNHAMRAFENLAHDENVGAAIASTIGAGTIE